MTLVEAELGGVDLVVRGSAGWPDARIRLSHWRCTDRYHSYFDAEARDEGLHARLESVESMPGTLCAFVEQIAQDFRGWSGERSWTSNRMVVTATYANCGHVHLAWTLRPDSGDAGWECTVVTVIEAGEEMSRLATDLRVFMEQG